MSGPSITIAILTRNRSALLEKLFESLAPQLSDGSEVLVIDNQSTDDTPEVVERWRGSIPRLRRQPEARLGVYASRNAALAACTTEIVAFLDDDVVASPGWFQELRRIHSERCADSRPYMLGGPVLVKDLTPEMQPRWFSNDLRPYLPELNLGNDTFVLRPEQQGILGANFSLRLQDVRQLGDCGESLLLYGGDERALEEKILAAGGYRMYAGSLTVHHVLHSNRLTKGWMLRRFFDLGQEGAQASVRRNDSLEKRITTMIKWFGIAIATTPLLLLALLGDNPKAFRLALRGAYAWGRVELLRKLVRAWVKGVLRAK